jgi:predicted DsbA family dithiol-disulfide isomerase
MKMKEKIKVKVDVVSDVVCPWCYIGKRRLEKAIDQLKDTHEFSVTYLPFELNPLMPEKGMHQPTYLTKKFGSEEKYHQITQNVSEVAATEGLSFRFDLQQVSPNTRKAHMLLLLAIQQGKQNALKEALMKAYFTEGVDLSSEENLIRLAEGVGVSGNLQHFLQTKANENHVVELEKQMQQLGISGVPFFIINNKTGVSGAQPTATFLEIFTGLQKEQSLTEESCDVDGENC